ncbi:hypothetical protein L7F22_012601 [Adiantum nelumboides]|nr:hypothetical protein [Adiantum nelumboides]
MHKDWNISPPSLTFLPDFHYTREEWASMNAFVARLSTANILNFNLYGIWARRERFEEPLGKEGLDDHVPATATWVVEAGHLMFELALQAQPPDCINNASNGAHFGQVAFGTIESARPSRNRVLIL